MTGYWSHKMSIKRLREGEYVIHHGRKSFRVYKFKYPHGKTEWRVDDMGEGLSCVGRLPSLKAAKAAIWAGDFDRDEN